MRLSAVVLLFAILLSHFPPLASAVTQDLNVSASIPAQASDFQNEIESLTNGSPFAPDKEITYQVTYGSNLSYSASFTVEAQWYKGVIDGEPTPSVDVVNYVVGSATDGYNSTPAVVDTTNKKISWTVTLPANTQDQTTTFKLKTTNNYTGTKTVSIPVATRIIGPGVTTPDETITLQYLHPVSAPSTSTPSPTPAQDPFTIDVVEIRGIDKDSSLIYVSTSLLSNVTIKYGLSSRNLSRSASSSTNSKAHNISLLNLEPGTTYFFRIEANATARETLVSDLFVLNTAKEESETPKIVAESFIAIGQDNVLAEGKGEVIAVPTRSEFQIKFRLDKNINVKNIQAFLRPKVLGISSFLIARAENNSSSIELVELSNGEYSGRIKAPTKKGQYELVIRTSESNGNILEQKLADITVTNPLTVLNEKDDPIEGARVFFSVYNKKTRLFEKINQHSINIKNPSFTDELGEVNTILPNGKYKAEVSDIRYKDQEVVFNVGGEDSYPIIRLEKQGLSAFNIVGYYTKGLDEVYLSNTKQYIASLATSIRFFDLLAAFSLGTLIIITLFAFSKRHNVPVGAIHRYIPSLFEKNRHPERFIKGLIQGDDKNGLAGANVYLLDEGKEEIIASTKSDKHGSFFFKRNAQGGSYLLMAMKEGFESHPVTPYKEGTEITMVLNKNEHLSAPIHYIKHLFTGSISLTFETFLILSLFFELLFLDSFGLARTLPYFCLTLFNFGAWILVSRHHQHKISY